MGILEMYGLDMQGFLGGSASFGPEAQSLKEQMKADLCDWWLYQPKEVILTGGIGWGKSHFLEWVARRLVYEWAAPGLKIEQVVGGNPDYRVSILWMERTKEQAITAVDRMENFLKQGRFWAANGVKWERVTRFEIHFDNGLMFEAAWDLTAIVGTRYAAYINNAEIHYLDRSVAIEHLRRAQENLLNVCDGTSKEVRFLQHGVFAVASNSTSDDDILVRRIQWAKLGAKGIWYRNYKRWDIDEPKNKLDTQWFHVLLIQRRSDRVIEIVTDFTKKWGLSPIDEHGMGRNVERVIPVPIEYLAMFKDKPKESLRDLAGVIWG